MFFAQALLKMWVISVCVLACDFGPYGPESQISAFLFRVLHIIRLSESLNTTLGRDMLNFFTFCWKEWDPSYAPENMKCITECRYAAPLLNAKLETGQTNLKRNCRTQVLLWMCPECKILTV